MSDVELTITRGLRLHFHLDVGYDGTYVPRTLRNKDKVILHLLNRLKWKITFPDDDYLEKYDVTFEAVEAEEDLVKALRALIRIRGLRRMEAERLKMLPTEELCKEPILKTLVGQVASIPNFALFRGERWR